MQDLDAAECCELAGEFRAVLAAVPRVPVTYCRACHVGGDVLDPSGVVEGVVGEGERERAKVLVEDFFDDEVGLPCEFRLARTQPRC